MQSQTHQTSNTNLIHRTGKPSHKKFILPSGEILPATEIAEYPFNKHDPTKERHITPGIKKNSLLSTGKFADANFDKDEVNIYYANNTVITVTRGVILRGWGDPQLNLWHIPLVNVVRNNNSDTVIVNKPLSKFLPACPPPSEAIHNVYELKAQPELVCYYHAAAGFPTKPTWLQAIKNRHFTSWPGLTADAVACHYPDLEEISKGHSCRAPSGLCSTRSTPSTDNDMPDNYRRPILQRMHRLHEGL
jgi:hypothetical protein